MSEIACSLIAWLGLDLAAAVLAGALVVAFGFLVYGLTCAALWAAMAAYRASRCLRRDVSAYRASRCLRRDVSAYRASRCLRLEGFQRASLRHEPGKPAAGGADLI
jgi:hypothetical protein